MSDSKIAKDLIRPDDGNGRKEEERKQTAEEAKRPQRR
jgi:hypothetical protein